MRKSVGREGMYPWMAYAWSSLMACFDMQRERSIPLPEDVGQVARRVGRFLSCRAGLSRPALTLLCPSLR